jgi:hypothetical protein
MEAKLLSTQTANDLNSVRLQGNEKYYTRFVRIEILLC